MDSSMKELWTREWTDPQSSPAHPPAKTRMIFTDAPATRTTLVAREGDLTRQLAEAGMPAAGFVKKSEGSRRFVYQPANGERRASIVAEWGRWGRKDIAGA